jgi:hypothetical protein
MSRFSKRKFFDHRTPGTSVFPQKKERKRKENSNNQISIYKTIKNREIKDTT